LFGKIGTPLFCTLAALLLLASSSFAAPRKVLVEEATNWACPPCYDANPVVNSVLAEYGNQVVAVKWHVWWPGADDPWYNANTGPVDWRIGMDAIDFAPWMVYDGVTQSEADADEMRTSINARLQIASPISIVATGTRMPSSVHISADINVEQIQVGVEFRAFAVLTEEMIPGMGRNGETVNPNGEPDNHDVFRHSNGTEASGATPGAVIDMTTPGLKHVEFDIPTSAPANVALNLNEIHGVIWVQNLTPLPLGGSEVLNAAEIVPAGPTEVRSSTWGAIKSIYR